MLLHRWSVGLEEFDFTIYHWSGKDQGHLDGLNSLPVEDAPPDEEESTLTVQTVTNEEADQQVALELHRTTHVRG